MDGHVTPVHLVQPLYKHLMGWPVTLRDLEQIDDQVYTNLSNLLTMEDIACLELDFVVTEDKLGVNETVELVPNGENIAVTAENLPDYLKAQYRYRTLGRIQNQLLEFLKGWWLQD